jgi:hypothetical protein
MSGSRSVMFGNMQYQISKPEQYGKDGYYYQRVRQLDRGGQLVGSGEFIVKSARPDSQDGLFDPNGGRQAGYAVSRSVFDLGRIGLGVLFGNRLATTGGIADFVQNAAKGFPLPEPLRREHYSWPGTEKPWEENTLNSDSRPTWQPGPIEKLLYGDPPLQGAGPSSRLGQPSAHSEASAFNAGAPAAIPAPSDSTYPVGGLAGRIAALAGDHPRNLDQSVPAEGGLLALIRQQANADRPAADLWRPR